MIEKKVLDQLLNTAKQVRRNIIELVGVGRAGHLGGSCSAADVITALYFYKAKFDAKNPKWEDRDRILLSKGHAALCQYAALGELGVFDKSEFTKVKSLGAMLQGHPDMTRCPGIEANTGSLGQGLSISLGMALGIRVDEKASKVYCIIGDGEVGEGQIWEAAMAASSFGVDNLVAIVDRNFVQATDTVKNVLDSSDITTKFKAFGWKTVEIDGHDMAAIIDALDQADTVKGKPFVIIANTVKGKGVAFAEGKAAYHNGTLTQEQYDQAIAGLQ